ncbi:MAG TPA: UDP-N-acetylmuramate dehydrogenase [Myxococcales bacterium]|nr:UDP-N-acetylmuramate dehydrogenase [Myxococcales bacterium]
MKPSSTELWARQLEGDIRLEEPLAQWTSIRVGGPAEILFRPMKLDQLVHALKIARQDGVPIAVLGGGANTLVGDEGVPGLTIKLSPDLFPEEILRHGEVTALSLGAGAAIVRLINQMKAHRLVGAEVLAGIPGTLGGAVTMNAGTKHGECMSIVEAVEVATPEGIGWLPRERLNTRYRRTDLPEGGVVTRVRFALRDGDLAASRAAMEADLDYRKRTQPLSQPNFGSVFKNPPGDFAGRLIESVGLKGHQVGQAQISSLHANWIVNLGGATAKEVVALMALAQQRVREATGVELSPEVKRVGRFT